jgi:uncharacterized protein (TIGR02611 family)
MNADGGKAENATLASVPDRRPLPDVSGLPRPLRAAAGRFWALRAQAERTRVGQLIWKCVVAVLGFAIIVVGIVLLPLPGPGWLIIFAGIGLWATEFAWAHRLLAWARAKVALGTSWIARWPMWAKVLAVLVVLAALYPLWLGYQAVRRLL